GAVVYRPEIRTAAVGEVLEAARAEVAQQDRPLPPVGRRRRVMVRVAVDENEVLPAVAVHVEETRPPTDVGLTHGGDARRLRAVQERDLPGLTAVAVEGVQFVLVIGDPQGRPAAAVVVAGG